MVEKRELFKISLDGTRFVLFKIMVFIIFDLVSGLKLSPEELWSTVQLIVLPPTPTHSNTGVEG